MATLRMRTAHSIAEARHFLPTAAFLCYLPAKSAARRLPPALDAQDVTFPWAAPSGGRGMGGTQVLFPRDSDLLAISRRPVSRWFVAYIVELWHR
jgi:hypothetical protein